VLVCLKTTEEILDNVWESPQKFFINYPNFNYSNIEKLDIDNVVLWEEIFFIPGGIGIYSAWKPYAEFYILTHNLFLKKEFIEKFYSLQTLLDRCKELDVQLQTELIWTPN